MAGYLVEEFVENEPTGRSWRVRATDPLEAAAKALTREKDLRARDELLRVKVSPRNRFGRYEFLDVHAVLSSAARAASRGEGAGHVRSFRQDAASGG